MKNSTFFRLEDDARRGSFTVEAAIIIPLFMIFIAMGMKTGIECYKEIGGEAEEKALDGMWVVDDFYTIRTLSNSVDESGTSGNKESGGKDTDKKEAIK